MKRFKQAFSLIVITSLLMSVSVSFASSKKLSLEEAITLSKENSATIRSVTNKEFSTQDTIRKNIQNSYQLENALETYYDYLEIYYAAQSTGHEYNQYLGKSKEYLLKRVGTADPDNPYDPTKASGLVQALMMATVMGQTDKATKIEAEITFIQYYIYFGDDVGLTKETKYEKFKKNEAMLQNSLDLIQTKYDQGVIAATKGTEAGAIKLYVALKDIKQGIDVQTKLLDTYKEGLENMEISYNQGVVSKIDYENQKSTVKIKELELENLTFTYDNYGYQFKKLCGLAMDTELLLTTSFDHNDYKISAPSTYYDKAYNSNMNYNNIQAELTYNEKNYAVMDKYLNEIDKDSNRPVYYQEKVDLENDINDLKEQLDNQKQLIESNVTYACNDLIYKKKLVEHNTTAVDLASAKLNSGIKSYKLGQITQLQLDQLKLQYESTLMTANINVRNYNSSIQNFELLINYGVAYSTGQ